MPSSEICKNCFLLRENETVHSSSVKRLSEVRSVGVFHEGQALISQGSIPTTLFCMANGNVQARSMDLKGNSIFFFSFKQNELFPLFSIFSKLPAACDFVATERTTTCTFPIQALEELIDKDPGLSKNLLSNCAMKGLSLIERLSSLLGKSAPHKVAITLYQLRDEKSVCKASRKVISEWTNLAPETVIRAIGALEKRKLVKRTPGGISIVNESQFRRYIGY